MTSILYPLQFLLYNLDLLGELGKANTNTLLSRPDVLQQADLGLNITLRL